MGCSLCSSRLPRPRSETCGSQNPGATDEDAPLVEPLPRAHVHKTTARLRRPGREGLGALALFKVLADINKVGESG